LNGSDDFRLAVWPDQAGEIYMPLAACRTVEAVRTT